MSWAHATQTVSALADEASKYLSYCAVKLLLMNVARNLQVVAVEKVVYAVH